MGKFLQPSKMLTQSILRRGAICVLVLCGLASAEPYAMVPFVHNGGNTIKIHVGAEVTYLDPDAKTSKWCVVKSISGSENNLTVVVHEFLLKGYTGYLYGSNKYTLKGETQVKNQLIKGRKQDIYKKDFHEIY